MTVTIKKKDGTTINTKVSNVKHNNQQQNNLQLGTVYTESGGVHFMINNIVSGEYGGTVYTGYEV